MQGCHTYKIAVLKYQGRCEQRKSKKKKKKKYYFFYLFFFLGGGQVGGDVRGGGGHRLDVNKGLKFLGKFKKKWGGDWVVFGGGGGGGSGWM